MRDRVADVLAQRAALDRGTSAGVIASVVLHVALAGAVIYSATHADPPTAVKMVSIQFAKMPGAAPAAPRRAEARPTPAPKIQEPKPVIEEPKPVVEKPVTKPPEKNTVPLSPFGQSTKKGSAAPAPVPAPPTSNQQPATSTASEVPIGGIGVTGAGGGEPPGPCSLYMEGMKRKIGSYWTRPQVAGGPTAVIYLHILRNGTITEAKIETPSGNPAFDRAALSATRSASPLNPLPPACSTNYLGVNLVFR